MNREPNGDSDGLPQHKNRTSDVSLDRLFDALSDPHRRHILMQLADENPRDVDDFVPRELAGDGETREVRMALHHVHLPKLDDAGFVRWDRETGQVVKGPRFDAASPVVDLVRDTVGEFSDEHSKP